MKSINVINALRKHAQKVKAEQDLNHATDGVKRGYYRANYLEDCRAIRSAALQAERDARAPLNDAIDAWRKAEHPRAGANLIEAVHVIDALALIEERLALPRTRLNGVKVIATPFASAYSSSHKWATMADFFTAECKDGKWFVTGFERKALRSNKGAFLTLTDEVKAELLHRFSAF